MHALSEATNALGAALLHIAVVLLVEELSFGGLVRLVLASRPLSGKRKERKHTGEKQCSH